MGARLSLSLLLVIAGMSLFGFSSAGGSGLPPNPVPTIEALSPNSSTLGGESFTLSVVGSNFMPGSTVQWNAASLHTTFVSNTLLTAYVPSSFLSMPGPDAVTVVNPAPGGMSNSLNFVVPCVIPTVGPASKQTRARLGAYYFDGWSGPLTNFHFDGLPFGTYQDRQPLSGWEDNSSCAVEQQLAWAHGFGIDFFVFDWYFNAEVHGRDKSSLNTALQITHSLSDRHGMKYAILYVNGPPFVAGPAAWNSAVNEWIGYMKDPAYERVNGKPVLFIINVGQMHETFGSTAAVEKALGELRAAAKTQGLGGVYVVGGFGVPDGTLGQDSLSPGFSIAQTDGYDAVAFYNYPFAPTPVNGMLPFSTLADAAEWTWSQAVMDSTIPFIPTAMDGWDPRPWDETEPITGDLLWYGRTPQDVATLVESAISWTSANPTLRPEPAPAPPLVLIEAWNELGEGSYMVPTVGDGISYGDALATMLTTTANASRDAVGATRP